jgi:hypothetical protein
MVDEEVDRLGIVPFDGVARAVPRGSGCGVTGVVQAT